MNLVVPALADHREASLIEKSTESFCNSESLMKSLWYFYFFSFHNHLDGFQSRLFTSPVTF